MRRKILFWGWTGIILILSLIPSPEFPQPSGFDKIAHSAVYGILGWLGTWFLGWFSIPFGIVLGAGIEILQKFVPGRSSELGDLLADCIGILLGVIAFKVYKAIKR